MKQVNKEKDFGIVFHNQLKLHANTALVARKSNGILALIHQCYNTLDSTSFMTLYKTSLVCPILECENIAHGAYFQRDS